MYRLPPRRKRQRSGIERAPKREWRRHRRHVRGHHCMVTGCMRTPVEAHHPRDAANSGTGLKPHDAFCVPLCTGMDPEGHHEEYHRIGRPAFEKKYGVNFGATAAELVRTSPDKEMRESLRLVSAEELEMSQ